jgi:hypothetical protein
MWMTVIRNVVRIVSVGIDDLPTFQLHSSVAVALYELLFLAEVILDKSLIIRK